jgi:Bacterial regulatory proteins, luxR family
MRCCAQAIAEAPDVALPGLGQELRGLALISLGITEVWAAQFEVGEPHLEQEAEPANELHVSRNTIRTHLSHLYAKLDTHSRTEAVERARALGLLAPLARRR